MNKNKALWKSIRNVLLIILGSVVLAFADAAFITPMNLVIGGVISLGLIVQHFVDLAGSTFRVVDIVTGGIQIFLLIFGFFFLGKKFTLKTVLSSVLTPLLFSLLYRVPLDGVSTLGEMVSSQFVDSSGQMTMAYLILGALVGGALIGVGVGLTYLAGGSTGGFDVISVLLAKHTPIKEGVSSFVIDGALVIVGIFCFKDIPLGIVGVLGALVVAIAIQFVYVNANGFVIAEVISQHPEAITDFVVNKMDRTTTVIEGVGGYSGENKKVIRVCFARRQLSDFKAFLAETDPRAFVTFTNAGAINGEGFDPLVANITPVIGLSKKKEEPKDK